MVGAGGANALCCNSCGAHNNRAAHAISHGADLALSIHSLLCIEPVDQGSCIRLMGFRREVAIHRHHFFPGRFILEALADLHNGCAGIAIIRVDTQHSVAALSQSSGHLAECRSESEDVRPHQYSRMGTFRRMHEQRVTFTIWSVDFDLFGGGGLSVGGGWQHRG